AGDDARFVLEAQREALVLDELRVKNLQRDMAIEPLFIRSIDDAHAAGAERLSDAKTGETVVGRKPHARKLSRKQPRESRGAHVVAGKDRPRIREAQMRGHDLREDVAEVRGDGEVAPIVASLHREARPCAVDASTAHGAADDEHRVAVSVIRAAVAVLADGA